MKWEAGSPSNTVAWAEAYHYTKWHLGPSNRLATTVEIRLRTIFIPSLVVKHLQDACTALLLDTN